MGCGASAKSKYEADGDDLAFLSKVELFQRLPKDELPKLAEATKKIKFAEGTSIITQGEAGDAFYVMKSGKASVRIDDKEVSELKAGDFFGEVALLRHEPRAATITALSEVCTLKITQQDFVTLGFIDKLEFPKRGAVGGGGAGDVVEKQPPCPKSDEESKLIAEALKSNTNLPKLFTMDDNKIAAISALMWKIDVPQGEAIIEQGSYDADCFYIVNEGKFSIVVTKDGESSGSPMGEVEKGGSFGELALMYHAPRAATLTATVASQLFVIDRVQFKNILVKSEDELLKVNVEYLDKVGLLQQLKDSEKKEVAKALADMRFWKGDTIFNQGEEGKLLYILIDGVVSITKDGELQTQQQATPSKAVIFGERALLSGEPRAASVQVLSDHARALTIDKLSFEMLIGPLDEIIRRGRDGSAEVKKVRVGCSAADGGKRFGNIARKDLKMLRLLGCGGFGAVHLVEHKTTQATYALKVLSKGYVVKSGMQASVMSEKTVQLMCDSPFIVKLYECYNGSNSLYLLLELALGGELYATYNRKSLWGKEACAHFYCAGTTLAFEHLHGRKIIFRDLKPENLLLNEKGQVKLTDMGLAKVVVGKTYTTCGTPDYFAPEIISTKGHTHAVDWWTLGILAFELMIGHPPFTADSPMHIYQKVMKGIGRAAFPKKCPPHVESFVKELCHSNPSERLPMKNGHTKNIKTHVWYKEAGFDWDDFSNLKMEPPYKPTVKSKKDTANFHARKEDMPPQIPYKDPNTGWDKDFATNT